MSNAIQSCPTTEQLHAFGLGKLSPEEVEALASHVDQCDSCCQKLASVSRDTLVERVQAARRSDDSMETRLAGSHSTEDGNFSVASSAAVPRELQDHPKFRILEVLGQGGMGVVYKAEHQIMKRIVALKVINKRFLNNPTAVARFQREVISAASLHHPNIVTAHDADSEGDLHYLVMELVDGVSLDRYVYRKGPVPAPLACHFIRQAATGLQHAHENNMVHRDIKPHNLMVNRKGQLKILDFGLARLVDEQRQTHHSLNLDQAEQILGSGSITQTGTVVGTPDFLSPEQAKASQEIDIRSDLYSLGCTFYFLLTGSPPFPTGTMLEKLLHHCESDPEKPANAPGEVWEIVCKLMAKRPTERFQAPAEVVSALAPYARLVPGSAPAPSVPKNVKPARAPKPKAPETLPGFVEAAEMVSTEVVDDSKSENPKRATSQKQTTKRNQWMLVGVIGVLFASALIAALIFSGDSDSGKNTAEGNKAKGPPNAPVARRKTVLMIVPAQGVFRADFDPVKQWLEEAGIKVDVTSTRSVVSYYSEPRSQYEVDFVLAQSTSMDKYDAVLVVGLNTPSLRQTPGNEALLKSKLQEMLDSKRRKYLTALCGGQQLLHHLDFLNGRTIAYNNASYAGSKWIWKPGITKSNEPVVVDGRVITGRSGEPRDVAEAFTKTLIEKLKELP